jgi:hypothetical protein
MHSDVEKVTAENNIGHIERGELDCRSIILLMIDKLQIINFY